MQDGGFRVFIEPSDSEDPDEPPAAAAPHPPIQASEGDVVDAGKEVVAEASKEVREETEKAAADSKQSVASTYATTDPTAATLGSQTWSARPNQ